MKVTSVVITHISSTVPFGRNQAGLSGCPSCGPVLVLVPWPGPAVTALQQHAFPSALGLACTPSSWHPVPSYHAGLLVCLLSPKP